VRLCEAGKVGRVGGLYARQTVRLIWRRVVGIRPIVVVVGGTRNRRRIWRYNAGESTLKQYQKINRLTANLRGAGGHPHFAPVLRELKDRSAVVCP
jgi:hypothetical protein